MAEFRFPGVFVEEIPTLPPPIAQVDTSTTAFVGQFASGDVGVPTKVTSWAEAVLLFGPVGSEASHGVRQFFLNGGSRAVILRVVGSRGRADDAAPSARQFEAALGALDQVDYSLLCLPAMAAMDDSEFTQLVSFLNHFCDERGIFFFVDPNVDNTRTAIAGFDMSVGSRNNAVYFPRIEVPDASTISGSRLIAPSGTMAGIYARTDTRRGVWKAPAGREASINGGRISKPSLSDADTSRLATRGINAMRHLPSIGGAPWGARTGEGANGNASDWRYVPVRRFAMMIEQSLHKGLQWAVFEPNGEPLWAKIRLAGTAFLEELFRRGAFAGSSMEKAYFLRCGRDTTTQADIAKGIVNVTIGFAPLKPAEFVITKMRIRSAAQP